MYYKLKEQTNFLQDPIITTVAFGRKNVEKRNMEKVMSLFLLVERPPKINNTEMAPSKTTPNIYIEYQQGKKERRATDKNASQI